jgi:hypothetical protein
MIEEKNIPCLRVETDYRKRHWAPRNMDILGLIVDKLLTPHCRRRTIELEDIRDVLFNRQFVGAPGAALLAADGNYCTGEYTNDTIDERWF